MRTQARTWGPFMLLLAAVLVACEARSLTITVKYPHSKLSSGSKLTLRGEGLASLSWVGGLALNRVDADTWSIQLASGQPGAIVKVKALVNDETYQIGANTLIQLTDADNQNVTLFPWFYALNGRFEVVKGIYSPQFRNSRSMAVYVPPSYDENTLKTYDDVLIMHDGQNLFDPDTSFGGVAWMCQDTVDNLVVAGAMREIIIAGPYNTDKRTYEYTFCYDSEFKDGGGGDLYLDFLQTEVLSAVKKRYRVALDGVGTSQTVGILGSSLGGLISCYAAVTRPSIYGRGGCMSSTFMWGDHAFINKVLTNGSLPQQHVELYLDSGDRGAEKPYVDGKYDTIDVRDALERDHGYVLNEDIWYYLDKGADHSEKYWGARFWIPMVDLYPPSEVIE